MPETKKVEMKGTEDLRKIIADEINQLRMGTSNPSRGNAVANLLGKLIQSVKLDIEVHRYVTNDKRSVKSLNTPLINTAKQLNQ